MNNQYINQVVQQPQIHKANQKARRDVSMVVANNVIPSPVQSSSTLDTHNGVTKKPRYINIKAHGKYNALEVSPDETTKGWYTFRLEAAPKLNDNTKAYDWKNNKLSVQITKTELPVMIGVLLGYLPSPTC